MKNTFKHLLLFCTVALASGTVQAQVTGTADTSRNSMMQGNNNSANQDMNRGYYGDYNSFRKYNDSMLLGYNQQIYQFKNRWIDDPAERKMHKKRVDSLTRQSTQLRRQLSRYRQSDTTNWNNFQQNYNRDMRRLDSSLRTFPPAAGQRNNNMQNNGMMRRDSL